MTTEQLNNSIINLNNCSRIFQMGEISVTALADINLDIKKGEFVTILGPSGSGKSTLLNLIGGMDRPSTGQIYVGDNNLVQLNDKQLTEFRRKTVGFIFQLYNLIPTLTAYENVQIATELTENALDPAEALKLVGLSDRIEHFPSQLSGGEQQRVSIARALAKRPSLLLSDEPTGALDLPTARKVLSILKQLNVEQELTIILITHNPAIAEISSRVIRMASGRIEDSQINENPISAEEVTW